MGTHKHTYTWERDENHMMHPRYFPSFQKREGCGSALPSACGLVISTQDLPSACGSVSTQDKSCVSPPTENSEQTLQNTLGHSATPGTRHSCQTTSCTMLKPWIGGVFLLVGTCDSFSPKLTASFLLSVLLMYFCFWNILSRAFLWSSENTALLKIPLRALEFESWVSRGSPCSSPGREIQKDSRVREEKPLWPSECSHLIVSTMSDYSLSTARAVLLKLSRSWSSLRT